MSNNFITTYVLKITTGCNLRCKYCYSSEKKGFASRIDKSVLEKLFTGITRLPSKRIQFIWHGGEPLLVGKSFFSEVLQLQRRILGSEFEVINNVQTNGTLLDEGWIDFLFQNNFGIGISIDGPEDIHNLNRVSVPGYDTHTKVMEAVSNLTRRGYPTSVCCVVTKQTLNRAREIYEFFCELGVKEFDPIPCLPYKTNDKSKDLAVDPLDYAKFLIDLFDIWFAQDNEEISIRYLSNVLQGISLGHSSLCKLAGTCASFLSITPKGDVYPCDSFIGYSEYLLGNLQHETLETIVEGYNYARFIGDMSETITECAECDWFRLCKGGCSFQRYIGSSIYNNESYYCLSNKLLFQHIRSVLNM